MRSSNGLDARAQAMRSVFEQTRSAPAKRRPADIPVPAWDTSVGAAAMDAIFEQVFECARQEASIVDDDAQDHKRRCERSPLRSRIPRRKETLVDGRHAHVINELMEAHRMFQ